MVDSVNENCDPKREIKKRKQENLLEYEKIVHPIRIELEIQNTHALFVCILGTLV